MFFEKSVNSGSASSKKNRIDWVVVFFMVVFHAGAIAALFMFSWKALFTALVLWWMANSWGIGIGYHRLLTHRGYKVPLWLEYFLTVCGTLALEGGPIGWVGTHRIHHQNADKAGDPHSPRDGTWWSHMGWVLTGVPQHNRVALSRYTPDLAKDKFHLWISKFHYAPSVALALAILVFLGWPCLMWGIFLRITIGLHTTWLVNSATHLWGSRRFSTHDDSRNNWWVALLTFGEGWHNNHHAHPTAARHGVAWYEVDMNWYGIWFLKKIGLARMNTAARA